MWRDAGMCGQRLHVRSGHAHDLAHDCDSLSDDAQDEALGLAETEEGRACGTYLDADVLFRLTPGPQQVPRRPTPFTYSAAPLNVALRLCLLRTASDYGCDTSVIHKPSAGVHALHAAGRAAGPLWQPRRCAASDHCSAAFSCWRNNRLLNTVDATMSTCTLVLPDQCAT